MNIFFKNTNLVLKISYFEALDNNIELIRFISNMGSFLIVLFIE